MKKYFFIMLSSILFISSCKEKPGENKKEDAVVSNKDADFTKLNQDFFLSLPATAAEFEARKKELMIEKKVDQWPKPVPDLPITDVIPLSAYECLVLGGKLVLDRSCAKRVKCVGTNGGEMCIQKIK